MHGELIFCSQFPNDNSKDELFSLSTPLDRWMTFEEDFGPLLPD